MTELGPDTTLRHVALVGLMGSGKTTIGRILADRSGRPLVDTDDLVEQATGRSVSELFSHQGEAAFRRYEVECLARALAHADPSVLATGGGIVLSERSRALLHRDATVVWLRASPECLAERLADDRGRPLLQGRDALEVLTELESHRAPLYEAVADAVVDADGPDPLNVADRVATVLGWTS